MTSDLLQQTFDEADFVVVDVETTGLSVENGDRVCEIGAVNVRGGAIIETFGSLIDPRRPISAGAYEVNKISPQMLYGAPIFQLIAPQFQYMIDGSVLVAYNAPFDVSFLVNEFRLAGFPPPDNTVVDALVLARQIVPGLAKYPQENVAEMIGIPFPVKHRALEDAMVTTQIFLMFLSILKAYDFNIINDLLRRDLAQQLYAKRMRVVQNALVGGNNLWIKYLSTQNSKLTERIITPKQLAIQASSPQYHSRNGTGNATHLIAYCHSAQGERNFRIDRILDMKVVK